MYMSKTNLFIHYVYAADTIIYLIEIADIGEQRLL